MINDKTNKWNVLNWKERKQYERETEGLDIDLWRWEFLRRDAGYRRAWKTRGKNEDINAVHAAAFDLPEFIDPAQRAIELKDKLKFLRTWEGTQLYNLRCSIVTFFSKKERHEVDNEFFTSYFRSLLCDKEKAVFAFDLTKPLELQIGRASIALNALQENYRKSIANQLARNGKKMPRRGATDEIPEVWLRQVPPNLDHLRVLDARAEKVSFAKIGQIIFYVKGYDEAAIRASREYSYARLYWKMT